MNLTFCCTSEKEHIQRVTPIILYVTLSQTNFANDYKIAITSLWYLHVSRIRYILFMIVIIIFRVISLIPEEQIPRRQIVYNLYSELQLKICGEPSGSPFVARFQSIEIWWQSKSKWCKSIGYNKLRKLNLFNRTLYCTSYKQAIHISAGLHPFFLPLFTND